MGTNRLFSRHSLKDFKRLRLNGINYARFRLLAVINRNRRMPSEGSNQMLNSIQTKQVNKVKPNVNRPSIPDGVVVSPSSYNRWVAVVQTSPPRCQTKARALLCKLFTAFRRLAFRGTLFFFWIIRNDYVMVNSFVSLPSDNSFQDASLFELEKLVKKKLFFEIN